jgi:hypothetical protein
VNYDTWVGVQATHTLRHPLEQELPKPKTPGGKLTIDDLLTSQEDTCYEARKRITSTTIDAAKLWEEAEQVGYQAASAERIASRRSEAKKLREKEQFLKGKALFLVGHATHTLQDSFSPDHGRRDSDSGNNDLRNICYYGGETKKQLEGLALGDKACYHPLPGSSLGDLIWIRSSRQLALAQSEWKHETTAKSPESFVFIPPNREAALKHEARLARDASARYYFILAKYLHEKRTAKAKDDVAYSVLSRRLTDQLFEGNAGIPGDTKMAKGVLRCDRMQANVIPAIEEPAYFAVLESVPATKIRQGGQALVDGLRVSGAILGHRLKTGGSVQTAVAESIATAGVTTAKRLRQIATELETSAGTLKSSTAK